MNRNLLTSVISTIAQLGILTTGLSANAADSVEFANSDNGADSSAQLELGEGEGANFAIPLLGKNADYEPYPRPRIPTQAESCLALFSNHVVHGDVLPVSNEDVAEAEECLELFAQGLLE